MYVNLALIGQSVYIKVPYNIRRYYYLVCIYDHLKLGLSVILARQTVYDHNAMATCAIPGCRNAPRAWQKDGRTGFYKKCWDHRNEATADELEYNVCQVAGCGARCKWETCYQHRETAVFKPCAGCGTMFPGPVWKKTCPPCFRRSRTSGRSGPGANVLAGLAAMAVSRSPVVEDKNSRSPPPSRRAPVSPLPYSS